MQATVRRGPHQESDQILALGGNQFSVLVRQFSDSIADDFEFQPVYLSAVAQILFVVIEGDPANRHEMVNGHENLPERRGVEYPRVANLERCWCVKVAELDAESSDTDDIKREAGECFHHCA